MLSAPWCQLGATLLPLSTTCWLAPVTSVMPGHPSNDHHIFKWSPGVSRKMCRPPLVPACAARTMLAWFLPSGSGVFLHGSGCRATLYRRVIQVFALPDHEYGYPLIGTSRAAQYFGSDAVGFHLPGAGSPVPPRWVEP